MENNSQTTTALINPNKLYKIETKLAPGMVLEIQKGLKKEETPIVLDKSTDASYQFFKLKPKGDNYIIESFPFQNFVIDVFHSKMVKENKIQIVKSNNTDAQTFKFLDAGDGYVYILSIINQNFCLDVPYSKANPGNKIWLYQRNNSDAQKFKLIGMNFINQSIDYAKKYALEKNPEYETKEDNSTNYCSQCLVAGGVDQDDIWKKGAETFYESDKFKKYFTEKRNVEWKESPKINDIKTADIIFCKESEKKDFAKNMFVVRTSVNNVVFCSNSKDLSEEYFQVDDIEGVLKTSCFFK